MASVHSYRPINPSSPLILGSRAGSSEAGEDGLFYLADSTVEVSALTQELINQPGSVSFLDYQVWAETGWKTEHGSYGSVERFTGKLSEEYGELVAAFEDPDTSTEELLSEMGDVLWCTTALVCNGGGQLDGQLKGQLYNYSQGITHFAEGQPTEPVWRSTASLLAKKWEPLTIDDIAELIVAGFEPTPSTNMNLEADELFDEPADHLYSLFYWLHALGSQQDRQFGYNEELVTLEAFKAARQPLEELGARAILEIAFIANHLTLGEFGLHEVISRNVQKVSDRITARLVDKTDGQRPTELL